MFVKNIVVKDFRNIRMGSLELSPNLNIFVGDNGHGKTSILEAIYFCLRGFSFRQSQNEQLISLQASISKSCFLNTQVILENLDFKILAYLEPGLKKLFLNQKPVLSTRLAQTFPIVLFTPESLQSIKEGPEFRRNLIDEVMVSYKPYTVTALQRFNKALRARNALLRRIGQETSAQTREDHLRTLKSLNVIYLKASLELTLLRMETIKQVYPHFKAIIPKIFENEKVDISVEYLISNQPAISFLPEQVHQNLYKRALELRDAEIAAGKCLVGPHKHDIKILFNGQDSRFFCSQGQQRALILAFKLASVDLLIATHQKAPLLMLDDVLSELDLDKRWFLIKYLKQIQTQILMTGTDLNMLEQFSDSLGTVYVVKNGEIEKLRQLNREGIRVRE